MWKASTLIAIAVMATLPVGVADSVAADRSSGKEITQWIEQLRDDSFLAREDATRKLSMAGPLARIPVRQLLESSEDADVRFRCRLILKEIEGQNIAAKREAFVDGDLSQLPGNRDSWEKLVGLVGNSRQSRKLFVLMQSEAADFLDLCETDPEQAIEQIEGFYAKYMEAYRRRGPAVSPGNIAAVIFLICRQDVKLEESVLGQCGSLLYGKYALSGKDNLPEKYSQDNEAFRTLVGRWVLKEFDRRNPTTLLSISQKLGIPEGRELARRMLEGNRHANAYKTYAMKTIGELGSEEDIPLLERYINNKTWVGSVTAGSKGTRGKETLGDLALGVCVNLSGQNLVDYGFPPPPKPRPLFGDPPRPLGNPPQQSYGFFNEKQRQASRVKWRQWRTAQNAAD